MKYSILSITKPNHHFKDMQNLIDELISDVTIQQWEAVTQYIIELEYDGTILHTYPKFNQETNELSQVFATKDLTTFEQRLYNSNIVKNLFDVAEKKGWHVRIENS